MRQLGKINCLEINKYDEAPWVILFHGYGAGAADLFSLGEVLSTKKPFNYLFPDGPLAVPIGPMASGKAWWPIDMAKLEEAMMSGVPRDMSQIDPEGLSKIVEKVFEMIRQMRIPWNQIVLGGFSQGAMLATEIFLQAPEAPKGLVLLSGTVIRENQWKEMAPKRAGSFFFQSHGTNDMVLGHAQAQKLQTLLSQAGLKGSLLSFKGSHEIPMTVIDRLGKYLDEV